MSAIMSAWKDNLTIKHRIVSPVHVLNSSPFFYLEIKKCHQIIQRKLIISQRRLRCDIRRLTCDKIPWKQGKTNLLHMSMSLPLGATPRVARDYRQFDQTPLPQQFQGGSAAAMAQAGKRSIAILLSNLL